MANGKTIIEYADEYEQGLLTEKTICSILCKTPTPEICKKEGGCSWLELFNTARFVEAPQTSNDKATEKVEQ